ncbi:hypothetical protein [Candidatus Sulfurimonas baltica]|uniref:Uncharacterized protein n=1 Tax=Candidatus Sulfurimonas baltica TaxID=2740404 RepID=A0A7S7LU66_9BACT|nr:hypothetical protein [Candidatus Sulfurimonas baltica]QOY51397.1 hypothetical protein HUE88_09735 [Candidatus Sulfurimonas baltica]
MITLSPYIIKLFNTEIRRYENVNTGLFSLVSIFETFHDEILVNANVDVDEKKAIKAGSKNIMTNSIDGIFKVGEYGYESELHHTVSSSSTTRTIQEAELLPFYFYLQTGTGSENALLFLQRFKIFGIRTILETYLQEHINTIFPRDKYMLHIDPLVFPEIIGSYFATSEVKRIRFIKSTYSDIADMYSQDNIHAYDAEFSVAIKRNRTFAQQLQRPVSDLFSTTDPSDYPTMITQLSTLVGAPTVNYDNVKVELRRDGKTKTVDLVNARKVRHSYDVTNDVVLGANGHPTIDSLRLVSASISTNLSDMIWD